MPITTTAYIINLKSKDIFEFIYMPFEINESKAANYADIGILGRSEPLKGYSYSTSRIFNLVLTQFAASNPWQEVTRRVQWLRSLVYPDYSGGQLKVPPPILLVIGDWLSSRCVCTDYQVRYSAPWSVGPASIADSLHSYFAEVTISLHEVNSDDPGRAPWDYNQVWHGQDFSHEV